MIDPRLVAPGGMGSSLPRRLGGGRRITALAAILAVLGGGCGGCGGGTAVRSSDPGPAPEEPAVATIALPSPATAADARHLLSRFTFGPRVGEPERVAEQGLSAWLEQQLAPDAIDEPVLELLAERYPLAFASPLDLAHPGTPPEDREDADTPPGPRAAMMGQPVRRQDVVPDLQAALLTRQTLGERQLLEVMVDFWFNHFNVSAMKGKVHLVVGDYLERAIRANALGRFEDMLVAVATHPAMLMYLDNASSSVERPGREGPVGGINENFARELLELHTVGVDGGYDQQDVIGAARVLTGWGVQELGFAYRDAQHDRGAKVVMGRTFPAGRGMEEGMELLQWLARHPSTVRHLARKLAVRFVGDSPSDALVDRIAVAWEGSAGDIPTVLRAIAADPELWAESSREAKVKAPLEWLVSAFRILGAEPAGVDVVRATNRLGQPYFAQALPTGYAEVADEWANGAQLGMRWQIAIQLSVGHLAGVLYRAGDPLPAEAELEPTVRFACDVLLGGASPSTEEALRRELGGIRRADRRREVAVAMVLSSPEFQRQ